MDALIRVGDVSFCLIAEALIAMLTLLMFAVAECSTYPQRSCQGSELARAEQEVVAQ